MDRMNGHVFDMLRSQPPDAPEYINQFSPHPDYNDYLKIHKVLVGEVTAKKLEVIHGNLKSEVLPRYLSVAGWAATEAALAQPGADASYRNNLLEEAQDCWQRALEHQLLWNEQGNSHLAEYSAPFRYALDLAHLPLLQAVVSGDVTKQVRRDVTRDVLNIAEANAVQLRLAMDAGNRTAISDHIGVGHECNAMLAFHSLDSSTLIVIPSSARADSGHHHPHQTHDLLAIQQKWGTIQDMTPIEIKASASQHDRQRYKALLVRGKMHLAVVGKYSPEHTLRAFSGFFNNSQTADEKLITDHTRQTVLDLYWLYKKGRKLQGFASDNSSCQYRDATTVHSAHPEIAPASM